MNRPALRVGTSGWVYKHWKGRFYPPRVPGPSMLAVYAEHFDTVEVNTSFYRLPDRKTFESWRAGTPANFLFSVKASRYLTHMKKLKDPEEPLRNLLDRAAGLQEKLGPILVQFPANWRVDTVRLEGFLEALASRGERWAFEFRHPSWLIPRIYRLLETAGAALVLPIHPDLPLDIRLTAPWTYVRFHAGRHGAGFSGEELREWAGHLRRLQSGGADAYVYFNNDWEGHALRDAWSLRSLLRGPAASGAPPPML